MSPASYQTAPPRDVVPCLLKSGKRDSNPRPQPWQGCALPTELFPQAFPENVVRNVVPQQCPATMSNGSRKSTASSTASSRHTFEQNSDEASDAHLPRHG